MRHFQAGWDPVLRGTDVLEASWSHLKAAFMPAEHLSKLAVIGRELAGATIKLARLAGAAFMQAEN